MLDKDPNKRITINDIMRHPWISRYKEMKIRREWGYDSSSTDSLILDEDNQSNENLSLSNVDGSNLKNQI